jgi:hypothetical protein
MIKERYKKLYLLFLKEWGQVIQKEYNIHGSAIYIVETLLRFYKVLIAKHEQLALIAACKLKNYQNGYDTSEWHQLGFWDLNAVSIEIGE